MQAKCLRLMGKKLLVALAMQSKFGGEHVQTRIHDNYPTQSLDNQWLDAKIWMEGSRIQAGESAPNSCSAFSDALTVSQIRLLFPRMTGSL